MAFTVLATKLYCGRGWALGSGLRSRTSSAPGSGRVPEAPEETASRA